jgi:hypothetical protein
VTPPDKNVTNIAVSPLNVLSLESDTDSGLPMENSNHDAISTKSSPHINHLKLNSSESNLKMKVNLTQNIMNDTNFSIDSSSHAADNLGSTPPSAKYNGKRLFTQQFKALILVRLHHYRRNMRVLLTNVFLPCLFVALSMAFSVIRPKLTKQMSLELSPVIYEPSQMFLS